MCVYQCFCLLLCFNDFYVLINCSLRVFIHILLAWRCFCCEIIYFCSDAFVLEELLESIIFKLIESIYVEDKTVSFCVCFFLFIWICLIKLLCDFLTIFCYGYIGLYLHTFSKYVFIIFYDDMFVFVCVSVNVFMYVCMFVLWTDVFLCLSLFVFVYVTVSILVYIYVCIYVCAWVYILECRCGYFFYIKIYLWVFDCVWMCLFGKFVI